jgi:hypothetical protein
MLENTLDTCDLIKTFIDGAVTVAEPSKHASAKAKNLLEKEIDYMMKTHAGYFSQPSDETYFCGSSRII